MAEIPHIRLTLSNRSENVLIVRQALSALAELVGLDPLDLNDISTAVTEACNNVVLHAYPEDEGPLEVEIRLRQPEFEVLVRDRGIGIDAELRAAREASGGLGLRVIQALVEKLELRPVGGVELRMGFVASQLQTTAAVSSGGLPRFSQAARAELGSTTAIEIAPAALAQALMPRLFPVLAAQAHFSVEGMAEIGQLTESLLGGVAASLAADRSIGATATPGQRELIVRLGPVPSGAAATLIAGVPTPGRAVVATPLLRSPNGPADSSELLALRLEQR